MSLSKVSLLKFLENAQKVYGSMPIIDLQEELKIFNSDTFENYKSVVPAGVQNQFKVSIPPEWEIQNTTNAFILDAFHWLISRQGILLLTQVNVILMFPKQSRKSTNAMCTYIRDTFYFFLLFYFILQHAPPKKMPKSHPIIEHILIFR